MRWRIIVLLLIGTSLGVWIRLSVTYKESPDCVYHLRRARFVLESFPRTVVFDPLMNFPEGGICIWPPLFDVALAVPPLVLWGSDVTIAAFEKAAYVVPVVFAAAAILAAGVAGLSMRRRWGVAAAFFVAISSGHLQYSQFGHTDQHAAESCWGFLTLALFLWSCKRKSWRLELATGFSLACAVLTWQGAIFWAPILGSALAAEILLSGVETTLWRVFRILGVAPLIVASATGYWLNGFSPPFTYVSFGWFQPVFLSATFAAPAFLLLSKKRSPVATSLLFVASVVPLFFFGSDFVASVRNGILHLSSSSEGSQIVNGGMLSYSKDWLSQILEYRPLLADEWDWPIGFLSFSFFLSPLAMILWGKRFAASCKPEARSRKNGKTSFYAALLVWAIFTFCSTLLQRRNVYYGSLLGALTAVELSAFLAVVLGKRLASRTRRQITILYAVIFLAFSFPMIFHLPKELSKGYEAGEDRLQTLQELKKLMPLSLLPYDRRYLNPSIPVPELKEAHSVLPFWSQGHLVTYYSELPVVANNFGYGFFDSLRFFLSESEPEALAIANAHRARLVLSLDIAPVVNRYGAALNKPDYIRFEGSKMFIASAYFRTIQARMHDYDGTGAVLPNGMRVEPLQHFKLRYASRGGMQRMGRFISQFKIFEVVP